MDQKETTMTSTEPGCEFSSCPSVFETDRPCGTCPPVPEVFDYDQPFGSDDGEKAWVFKEKHPTRKDAIYYVRSELDTWVDWTEYRVKTVWVRPYYSDWGYEPHWGIKECNKDDDGAVEFWEVRS